MPKFELQKVGFVNPDDLTETIVLSTILEGAGGATRAFVEEEPESFIFEDNQQIHDGQVYTFTMAGKPNSTDLSQLVAWADAGTKITITGYAYGQAIQVDNAIITFLTNPSERKVWKIGARKTGAIGYDSTTKKLNTEFMMSANLLNMYIWENGETAGLPAGWSKTGGSTTFGGNGLLLFSTTGVPDVDLTREVYLPFPGKEYTFFVNVTSVTVNSAIRIKIDSYNESGSLIASGGEFITATGINSVTDTLPDATNYVQLKISVGTDDSITFKDPGLTIGTSTTYISQ